MSDRVGNNEDRSSRVAAQSLTLDSHKYPSKSFIAEASSSVFKFLSYLEVEWKHFLNVSRAAS